MKKRRDSNCYGFNERQKNLRNKRRKEKTNMPLNLKKKQIKIH